MQSKDEVRAFLLEYMKTWPKAQQQDLIKLLFQSAFGCGHFAPSREKVISFLESELRSTQTNPDGALVEPVMGGYARVHIAPYAKQGYESNTLAKLFMLTALESAGDERRIWFDDALELLLEMTNRGELPFSPQDARAQIKAYREAGCPSVHHSDIFRAAYHPAYRIVREDYARALEVIARIDSLLESRERVIVAIDGNSGAGKSTFAGLLAKVYDGATLVHMDDFFLQMHQRTKARYETPGGNVDHERFLEEVLTPMRKGEVFCYRPFDCGRMAIGEGRKITPGRLCIVEGSYSLHPALEIEYDLKIMLRITPDEQKKRILMRNGPQMLERFIGEWIPMENLYFEATNIESRCDLLIGG